MSKQDLHGSVNLEYYRVFCSVCECGGITAAAEALCISQPAVSQAVRQLETALGCRLFLRTSRGVKLTSEGELLLSYVRRGIDAIQDDMPGLGTSDIKLFAFMFLIVSVFIGIYLPIQYKFGYEKTKFAFGVIIMASPFILPLLMRAGNLNLNFLSMFSPYLVYGGIVLIGFAILAISASLSIKIYDKADLA